MTTEHRQDWDAYWSGAGRAGVFSQFASGDVALKAIWSGIFADVLKPGTPSKVLDLACGSGAVSAMALEAVQQGGYDIALTCLDYSVSAVNDVCERTPSVRGVVADACKTPFEDGDFDVIASQFGLEYAGHEAFGEAARLLAPGGMFAAICHVEVGAIHKECADNLDTIKTVLESGFLPNAKSALNAAFALDRGLGSAKIAEETTQKLNASMTVMKVLIQSKGLQAADGLPARLFQDLGQMISRRRNFAPQDIYNWINAMTGELETYAGRMASMTGAAISEPAMTEIRQSLTAAGVTAQEIEKVELKAGDGPAAWLVKAYADKA